MEIQTTIVYDKLQQAVEQGYEIISAQGSSRCFAEGTLVRMFDGTLKAVEHIAIGDKVMNMHGTGYNTVVEVHSGIDDMYKVHQHRGIDYVVNSRHILSLKQTRPQRRKVAIDGYKSCEKRRITYLPYDKDIIHDFDISFYNAQSKNFKKRYTGFKNTLLHFNEKPLLIDPYYLGVWLGDGSSKRASEITNADTEIREYFRDFANSLGCEAREVGDYEIDFLTRGYCKGYINEKVREFCRAFYTLNLYNNKHVPIDYIYNSYDNRLKLLAGLIDTDGMKTKRNTYSITQTKKCIIDAILELCHITGFYTNGIKEKIAKMKRKDGSIYETKAYTIEINHRDFADLNKYIRVERKKVYKLCDRNYFATQIDISYVGKGKYYGFTLDNSPYFLLQDGTVVHNSGKTRNIMIWLIIWALQHENKLITITRCSLPTIRGSVFRDFIEVMQQLGIYKSRSLNKTHLTYILDNGTEFEFIPTENDDKLRGRRRDVLYCNEANETSYEAYNQLAMRTDVLKILDYNPSFDEDHWLNDLNRDKRTYHFITTYKDNPFISQTIIDEIESLQWKNPSLWQIFGLGQRAIVEGLIFKKFTVEKSIPSTVKKRWVGVDFGFTNDPTAIILVGQQDDSLYLKEIEYKKGMLTEQITEVLCSKELRNYEIICDSADPRLIKEIRLVAKNKYKVELHITPVKKSNNSIMPSIDKMTLYNLIVTENSYNIIKELKSYTYVKDREGKWLNKPIDKFNHSIDAVRYVVMERLLGKKKRRGLRITR